MRTASNAYFPQTMSVISLPEFDAGLAAKVAQHYERLKAADDLGMLENFRRMPELDAAFADISDDTVIAEYRRQQSSSDSADTTVKDAEFEILDKGDRRIGEDDPRSSFYAETAERRSWDPGGEAFVDAVDKLVLVHRLREVVSLLGFTRFEATSPDKDGELDLAVERAALAETITWLPAIENRAKACSSRSGAMRWSNGWRAPACRRTAAGSRRGGRRGPGSGTDRWEASPACPTSCCIRFRTC